MDSERKEIIDKLAQVSDTITNKKELVLKLAKNIEKNLDKPDIKNMCSILGIENPQKENISSIVRRLRDKHFPAISLRWIEDVIPREYKQVRKEQADDSKIVRLSEKYIKDNKDELKAKIKEIEQKDSPAKDIISKARIPDMEKYTWDCWLAEEIALLAIKLEKEHKEKHEDKLCKEFSKRAKSTRDARFATNMNAYEAIILAVNTTQSLKNAISGEWEFKTLWEILEDMDKCRECLGPEQCRKEKCKHECHRVVRPMTTKGLKWAMRKNEDLKAWDNEIKRLIVDEDDLCHMAKTILKNPKSKKLLGEKEQLKLFYKHIENFDCLQCESFIEKHPDFFKKE